MKKALAATLLAVTLAAAAGPVTARPASATPCTPAWSPIPPTTSPGAQVSRLYAAFFSRDPDPQGFAHWTGLLQRRRSTLPRIASAFATSPEFRSRYGNVNNPEFVRLVYRNVLRRDPDPQGFAHWTSLLQRRRLTRGGLMVKFSESAEFRALAANPPCTGSGGTNPAPPPSLPGNATPYDAVWKDVMLARLNSIRSSNGAPPLSHCGTLGNAALSHTSWMASTGTVSHTGAGGSSLVNRAEAAGYLGWTTLGENLAGGFPDVVTVVDAWMASPGHRANILNPSFVHVGLAAVPGGGGAIFWTQKFGAGGTC